MTIAKGQEGMAKLSATASVAKWVKSTDARMSAVVLDAMQTTINDAQLPLKKGGRIHVDTGFLRASGQQTFDALPVGPSRGRARKEGEEGVIYRSPDQATMKTGFKLGMAIYFGWTAVYARRQNVLTGFRDYAVSRWKTNVAAAVAKLAKKVGR